MARLYADEQFPRVILTANFPPNGLVWVKHFYANKKK